MAPLQLLLCAALVLVGPGMALPTAPSPVDQSPSDASATLTTTSVPATASRATSTWMTMHRHDTPTSALPSSADGEKAAARAETTSQPCALPATTDLKKKKRQLDFPLPPTFLHPELAERKWFNTNPIIKPMDRSDPWYDPLNPSPHGKSQPHGSSKGKRQSFPPLPLDVTRRVFGGLREGPRGTSMSDGRRTAPNEQPERDMERSGLPGKAKQKRQSYPPLLLEVAKGVSPVAPELDEEEDSKAEQKRQSFPPLLLDVAKGILPATAKLELAEESMAQNKVSADSEQRSLVGEAKQRRQFFPPLPLDVAKGVFGERPPEKEDSTASETDKQETAEAHGVRRPGRWYG